MRKSQAIYVELLDEGIQVWRPVSALKVGENVYQILETESRPSEQWMFPPGSVVTCRLQSTFNGDILAAFEYAEDYAIRKRDEKEQQMAQVKVVVTLKPSLLDAQGKVVQGALQQLGYSGVQQVRVGKYIELTVDENADLSTQVKEMCEKLLSNPVIEDYEFEVSQ